MSNYIGAEPSYGVFDRQILSGDGSTTQFNLDFIVAQPSSLLVSIDGVIQEPEYSYTTGQSSGTPHINFSEAPDNGARIFLIYMGRQLLVARTTTSSTYVDTFNGDGTTTSFTMTQTPVTNTANNFMVYINNVYQREGSAYAFTVTGSTITFTSAPPSGTADIQVYQLNGFNLLNTVADGSITRAKMNFDPEDDATALAIALG